MMNKNCYFFKLSKWEKKTQGMTYDYEYVYMNILNKKY